MSNRIAVIQGNIAELKVDAIVNPANNSLTKGFTAFKAIHKAAGPDLLEECRQLGGCATGETKVTTGYNLPVKWIFHTVGPIWLGGKHGEPEQLANCYRSCLALAEQNDVRTIAFPPISIGLYRFPLKKASIIAVTEVKEFLDKNTSIEQVIFISRSERCYNRFLLLAERMFGNVDAKKLIQMTE